jgi:hypothetical protein
MGKCLFDRTVSKISLSLLLLIREPVMSNTNEMSRQTALDVDRPTRATNCLGHASIFAMNNEVYDEPISTLFNVTEPDKGASSAPGSFCKTAKM